MTIAALEQAREPLKTSDWLFAAEATVLELSQTLPDVKAKFQELRARLTAGEIHVAVVGQFKRGKSTLLNALLGETLSPSGILPLTTVPVFVRPGRSRQLHITYSNGSPPSEIVSLNAAVLARRVEELVSEDCNAANHLGLEAIEVTHPAPILANGIVLIDTPGIGSTLEHNTATAIALLPKCDIAILVVSPDPPVTRQEIEFLKLVKPHVQRIIVVLNKIDLLDVSDRDRAIDFLRAALKQTGETFDPTIIPVSAKQALAGKTSGDVGQLAASGLDALDICLQGALLADRQNILESSVAAKAKLLIDLCRTSISMSLRANEIELDDLDRLLGVFEQAAADIRIRCDEARDILDGDRRRLFGLVERESERLRMRAEQALAALVEETFLHGGPYSAAVESAIPKLFGDARDHWQLLITGELGQVFDRHNASHDSILSQIQNSASSIFGVALPAFESARFTAMERAPHWVKAKIDPIFAPLVADLVDSLLPRTVRRQREKRRMLERCHDLVLHNVENLRWTMRQNIEAALRKFWSDFEHRMSDAVMATKGAVERTLANKRSLENNAASDIAVLRQGLSLLDQLSAHTPNTNLKSPISTWSI